MVFKSNNRKRKGLPNCTGEIYTVYSKEGASRGGHYHIKVKEWFTLLTGKCVLELKDINTDELMTIELDSGKSVTVVIPPNIAHRFDAVKKYPFLVLAYTDQLYNPKDTIICEF